MAQPRRSTGAVRLRGAQVIRHGSFRMASGQRVQRYLCKTCRRTFSPNTGTPAYRIRKQEQWRE